MKVVVEDAISEHTGSTVVGAVSGSISVGSNNFFSIGWKLVMVEDGTIDIPDHQYQLDPPLYHSHNYQPDTLKNNYFFIEGKKIVLVGDKYSQDESEIKTAGSNDFVEVN